MIAYLFLSHLSIRAYRVEVSNDRLFDLSPRLDGISITYLRIEDIRSKAKSIITAYSHHIILSWGRPENNYCSLFDYIVVTKHYLEVLILFLTYDWTSWVYYATLTKHEISQGFIHAEVQNISLSHLIINYHRLQWLLIINRMEIITHFLRVAEPKSDIGSPRIIE